MHCWPYYSITTSTSAHAFVTYKSATLSNILHLFASILIFAPVQNQRDVSAVVESCCPNTISSCW